MGSTNTDTLGKTHFQGHIAQHTMVSYRQSKRGVSSKLLQQHIQSCAVQLFIRLNLKLAFLTQDDSCAVLERNNHFHFVKPGLLMIVLVRISFIILIVLGFLFVLSCFCRDDIFLLLLFCDDSLLVSHCWNLWSLS